MAVTISITNQPNQSFTISIPRTAGNLILEFFVNFNPVMKYWQMSITRPDTGQDLILNLPLVNRAPLGLLDAYEYLDIGNAYLTPLSADAPDYPGQNDWGKYFALVWV